MNKPRILVTAAAGKTGVATTLRLLEQNYPVRALVRCDDDRSRRLRAAGADVMVGSLEDMEDLRAALQDVRRAYFCPPLNPGALRRATLFAVAAQEAKIEVLVVLSQWLADPLHPAVHSREKWLSNKVFDWVPGIDIVTVNPGFFADNYLFALEPIAHFGLMAMPLGSGLNAPPSNEDIARVIVGALRDPAPHIGKTYRPTGPRLMSPEEIAATIGKVLGRTVRYQDAPTRLFLKAAKSLGISDFVMEELSWFFQDYQRGAFGLGAPSAAVLEVGQSEPESFELIVQRYAAKSSFTNRTPSSTARAFMNLVKVLLTAAPDPRAIARTLELPTLEHAVLAADSTAWRNSH